jgi:hypothetical protein
MAWLLVADNSSNPPEHTKPKPDDRAILDMMDMSGNFIKVLLTISGFRPSQPVPARGAIAWSGIPPYQLFGMGRTTDR